MTTLVFGARTYRPGTRSLIPPHNDTRAFLLRDQPIERAQDLLGRQASSFIWLLFPSLWHEVGGRERFRPSLGIAMTIRDRARDDADVDVRRLSPPWFKAIVGNPGIEFLLAQAGF